MSRNDKAQLPFTISSFEPKPGNGNWVSLANEMNLLPPPSLAVKLFQRSSILQLTIAPHPHHGSRSSAFAPHGETPPCLPQYLLAQLLSGVGSKQLGLLLTTCTPVGMDSHTPNPTPDSETPRYSPLSNHQIQHDDMQSPFAVKYPHPWVRSFWFINGSAQM